jgi:hypothetical protein
MSVSKIISCFFFSLLLLAGCASKDVTYDQNEIDKEVRTIQRKMNEKDYEYLYLRTSSKLKKELSKEQFIDNLEIARSRLGKRLSSILLFNTVEDIDGELYIISVYESHFEKFYARERFIFMRDNNAYSLVRYGYYGANDPLFKKIMDYNNIQLLEGKVKDILSKVDARDYPSICNAMTEEAQGMYEKGQCSAFLSKLHAHTGKHRGFKRKAVDFRRAENGQYFVILILDLTFEKNSGSGDCSFLYDPDHNTYTFSGLNYTPK